MIVVADLKMLIWIFLFYDYYYLCMYLKLCFLTALDDSDKSENAFHSDLGQDIWLASIPKQ